MLNSGITSTMALRRRASVPYSTNYYPHWSNVCRPFACSSSAPCCSCCCNSIFSMPLSPSYGCCSYGLRQSALVQWSPYRRLISGGFDSYSRIPDCDVDGVCSSDRVCSFREKRVGRRKRGLRKDLVYEERRGRYENGSVDEVEALLSLLTEDVGEECCLVREETQRLMRKPVVEKRGIDGVCSKCGSERKRVDVDVSESDLRSERGSVVSSRKNNDRREGIIQMGEEREAALLRKDNRSTIVGEERKAAFSRNRMEKEKDETGSLPRKKAEEKHERVSKLRNENWKVGLRKEEEEDLSRREEQRQKVRKDGSSCSSFYSLSSNGDYVSGNEIDAKGRFQEDLFSGQKRNSRNDEIVYQDTREEDQIHDDYRKDHGFSLTKKSSSKEFPTGSSAIHSEFRKKLEKRLTDISVEDVGLRTETSLKESKSSTAHESNCEKDSGYSESYNSRKEKSTGSMKLDEDRKQQLGQTGDEVSRQSETMLKYKQSMESQDNHRAYVRKDDRSAKVASSNQETVGKHQAALEFSTREDEYQKNSCKAPEESEIQEIDIRETSISQQKFDTTVRVEDYSTSTHSSIDDQKKQQQQYDQLSGLVESRGESQQFTKRDGKFILKGKKDEFTKQEGNINLISTSSLESKEPHSQMDDKVTKRVDSRKDTKRVDSRKETDELNKVLTTHSGNASARRLEDKNKTKSESPMTPPKLPETSALTQVAKIGIPTDEDAIGSAARFEKSSADYVGEYVKQVRHEIFSSEIRREKETRETKVFHVENLGVSHSKENDLGSDSQQSGKKGPSDEMWKVDEPSVQEPSKAKVQDSTIKGGNAVVKRTGSSLWNMIADIVLLRWSPHSERHSSGRKTGVRSSLNQSTSSESWFSGHEVKENEEAAEEKEGGVIRQSLSSRHREMKTHFQVEESPSSSTLKGQPRDAGIDASSSSVIQETGSLEASISLPSTGETSEGNSSHNFSAAVVDSSIPLPALRLQRSPAVQGDLELGAAQTSGYGMSEQLNTGSMEQTVSMVNEGDVKQKKLKRKEQVIRERFDEWAEAYRLESEQQKTDEMFMKEALLEAQKAADNWEVPIGAVLVHNGKIIARGCNLVEELRDSTAHAEILCIRDASSMLRTWRLAGTTLYVTLEPCPMCAGAILQARIDTLVWGAPNKLLGADGSWISLFPNDGGNAAEQSDKLPAPVHPFHPKMTIRRGVLAIECADAMQQFFKRRRKKDKTPPSPPPSCLPVSRRPSKFLAKMHNAFHLMLCL